MDDRKTTRRTCVGCIWLDELPGFPGTGYCKQGRGRITLLSKGCGGYRFDADALQRTQDGLNIKSPSRGGA